MFKGVFIGAVAADQPKRILILGESHHWTSDDYRKKSEEERAEKLKTYTTEKVVKNYLENYRSLEHRDNCYQFFDKIVRSFGVDPEKDRERFWSKVYFGNYVEGTLCGVGDSAAKKLIGENRNTYNDSLFTFVNQNHIDVIFCFSRRTFNALPSLAEKEENKERATRDIYVRGKTDYIGLCVYQPHIHHKHTLVCLEKELEAYSMRHPSGRGGYEISNYAPVLGPLFDEHTR